jgi:TRAP-type C4-dicarboxylate transport system permease small subunit
MIMSSLAALNKALLKIASGLTVAAMAVMAVIIPYEVVGRYVLGAMPSWSSEAAIYALVWATMAGSAVGLQKGYQVSLSVMTERLPPGLSSFVTGLMYLMMMIFCGVMIYFGLLQTIANLNQFSPAMGIPMAFPYLAIPVGFLVMLSITLERCGSFLQAARRKA